MAAGESARARVTLGSRGRRALRGRRKQPAYASITVVGTPATAVRVTLRR